MAMVNGADRPAGTHPRLVVLDGLRLFAALAVVFFHYVGQEQRGWEVSTARLFGWLHPVASLGWLGVNLFFLISGFVICMSSWGRSLGQFFTSRVVRLYPAYWFAVLLTTAFVAVLPLRDGHRNALQVLVNLTMLQSPMGVPDVDPVYWTLWVELHFYLLFAVVVWRGVTYRRAVAFCLLWTVASVLVMARPSPLTEVLIGPGYASYFIAGIAMYLMHRFGPTVLLWGIVVCSWVLSEHQLSAMLTQQSAKVGRDLGWWVPTLVNLGLFVVMATVALGWLDRVRGRWLVVAGSLTYPLYLLHLEVGWTIILVLDPAIPHWPLLFAIVAAMLLLAWLVHRYVERPVAGWLKPRLTVAVPACVGPPPRAARSTRAPVDAE
jgi:peptidoglycan/LPS O-acetylase OafA/YrhL